MKPIATKTIFLCLVGALVVFGVYAFQGAGSVDFAARSLPVERADRSTVTPNAGLPKVEPLEFLPIAPEDAIARNAATSTVSDPGPAAKPFFIQADNREAAINCLTSAIYYEAASEGLDGQRAVAQVVVNRARHPAFPASICGVIYQGAERTTGCQFTFSCDGALARKPSMGAWATAKRVATAALSGYVYTPVGLATHYHTNKVVPYWASSLDFANLIKTQLFYRWKGSFGKSGAFTRKFLEQEIDTASFIAKWQPNSEQASLFIPNDQIDPELQRKIVLKVPLGEQIITPAYNLKADSEPKAVLHIDKQTYVLLADKTNAKH
jgi:spore germination cell wall hydrolase CwlJ-like protein